jgi:hypothetical protein
VRSTCARGHDCGCISKMIVVVTSGRARANSGGDELAALRKGLSEMGDTMKRRMGDMYQRFRRGQTRDQSHVPLMDQQDDDEVSQSQSKSHHHPPRQQQCHVPLMNQRMELDASPRSPPKGGIRSTKKPLRHPAAPATSGV